MGKQRLDVLLVEQGLAQTRQKAQALIMAGNDAGYQKDDGDGTEAEDDLHPQRQLEIADLLS